MCKRAACFAEIQLSIMEAGENEKELHLCEAIPQLIRYPKTARYFDRRILVSFARQSVTKTGNF